MELLTGEFKVTLDEKGRISLPAHLRRILNDAKLTITQCKDNCLWVYTESDYTEFLKSVKNSTNPLNKDDRILLRHLFNSHSMEIDKVGRISITQGHREFAGLNKDCVVLGQGDYIEIWAQDRYEQFLENSGDDFEAASEKLGNTLKNRKGGE